ncbi:MAG TPA: Ig-like domain-containing protein [Planctomycetota bacterium]|jgi:hypothetical protein|nr:Ig-like domain-containing protein [Planctomycetota bacterium]
MAGRISPFARGLLAAVALAPLFPGCTRDGGGGRRLRLLSTSLPADGVLRLNEPIAFHFNERIDPDSISPLSLGFLSSNGAPVVGTAFVDPCSGGKSLVFQPACPTDDAYSNGGLQPGAVYYAVTVPGGHDLGAPRALDGDTLRASETFSFRTPDPAIEALFADANPLGPPQPSASLPPAILINAFTDPAQPLLVSFDQPLDPASSNLSPARFVLDFEEPLGSGSFVEAPREVVLLANCESDAASGACPLPRQVVVAVVPIGILPPGRVLRLVVKAGLRDIGGEQTLPADVTLGTIPVQPLGPAGAGADAFLEEFASGANEDDEEPFEVPFADWGDGVLAAPDPLAGFGSDFDWFVAPGQVVVLDTTLDTIVNGPGEELAVVGGVVNLRHLFVSPGSRVIGQGPNPLVIHASGRITVAGEINADGIDAVNTASLNTPNQPQSGAPGNCGGGKGGTASPSIVGSDIIGEDGFGPGDVPAGGGRGGHSSYGIVNPDLRHAGGGGGGVFTLKVHTAGFISPFGLNGGNGSTGANDCVDFLAPPDGGAHGPDLFVDADPTNDFFGRKFVPGGSPLAGELAAPIAGQGGAAGGDEVFYNGTPPPPNCLNNTQWLFQDRKGGAGGGGAGILILRALGPIVIASSGKLSAVGGRGGNAESILFINPGGGSGGGGSGGMVIVESADASNPDPGLPPLFPASTLPGGVRIEGSTPATAGRFLVKGGDGGHGESDLYVQAAICRGGEGGGGIAQVHTARFDAAGNPVISLAGSDVTAFSTPTIDQAGNGYVLLPSFPTRSRARSRWVDTGYATLGGMGGPLYEWLAVGPSASSNPDYPLDADGRVRTGPAGEVPLLPPIPSSMVTIPVGSLLDHGAVLPGAIVANPAALVNDAFNPNAAQPQVFTIVSAAFDGTNTVLSTSPEEGSLLGVLGPGPTTEVRIHPRPFRIVTGATPDVLTAGASARLRFEGADSIAPVAGGISPIADLAALAGKRFFRFTVDFDLNEPGNAPLVPGAPRPAVRYLKIPFRF